MSVKVCSLPLQCIDDSNKLLCNMSNSYSVWFAFRAFLGIVRCERHIKTDERKTAVDEDIPELR